LRSSILLNEFGPTSVLVVEVEFCEFSVIVSGSPSPGGGAGVAIGGKGTGGGGSWPLVLSADIGADTVVGVETALPASDPKTLFCWEVTDFAIGLSSSCAGVVERTSLTDGVGNVYGGAVMSAVAGVLTFTGVVAVGPFCGGVLVVGGMVVESLREVA
jgi:hypothetical protein